MFTATSGTGKSVGISFATQNCRQTVLDEETS